MNEAFRRWFGKSVLVDKAGKPLVLYHGTDATFNKFKISDGNYGQGIYLAPAWHANKYADGEGGRLIPLFARVEHPLIIADWDGPGYKTWSDDVVASAARRKSGMTVGKWLQHLGYDGVILMDRGQINMVNVLSPKQVKSATGNRGTWSRATSVLTNPSEGRSNPSLGNTGWEFKQMAYLELLARSIELEGLNPTTAAEEMAEKAFQHQKKAWQEHNGKILPVKEYPALRAMATIALAQFVSKGGLRPPGPRLRRNPTTLTNPLSGKSGNDGFVSAWDLIAGQDIRGEAIEDYGTMYLEKPRKVIQLDPNKLQAYGRKESLKDAFKDAKKWQVALVNKYAKKEPKYPGNIIIVEGDVVVDGHHRAMAAIKAGRSVPAIDLAGDDVIGKSNPSPLRRRATLTKSARRSLKAGTRVELEHVRRGAWATKKGRALARTIASHHLAEFPDYYRALSKMERGLSRSPHSRRRSRK